MSLLDSIKKAQVSLVAGVAAVTGLMAQSNASAHEVKPATPIVQKAPQTALAWDNSPRSLRARQVFESLPDKYKAFVGKSFKERVEMREYMEQKDFIQRDQLRKDLLRKNPSATIADFENLGGFSGKTTNEDFAPSKPDAALNNKPLTDVKTASLDLYTGVILPEMLSGKLTVEQARMVQELIFLGQPIATIDMNAPLSEQLANCGFDVISRVATGEQKHLTAEEKSRLIAEVQESELLRFLPQNEKDNVFLNQQLSARTFDVDQKGEPTEWKTINGKKVLSSNIGDSSFYGNITREVGEKIKKENTDAICQATAAKGNVR